MAGRKVFNEFDAQRCLAAVRRSGAPLGAWARDHGIDGRSLNLWRTNLARRGHPRPTAHEPRLAQGERVFVLQTREAFALGLRT